MLIAEEQDEILYVYLRDNHIWLESLNNRETYLSKVNMSEAYQLVEALLNCIEQHESELEEQSRFKPKGLFNEIH